MGLKNLLSVYQNLFSQIQKNFCVREGLILQEQLVSNLDMVLVAESARFNFQPTLGMEFWWGDFDVC
jgi:hypothetical protein